MSGSDLSSGEEIALRLLAQGPDCISTVDDENKLAAALTYEALRHRGLIQMTRSEDGPIWSLTTAGDAIARRLLDR